MVSTTKTLGPLHLEDLEPRRFEDLVRQLLYDFRPWRQIEATGRSGADGSFDARAWEAVSSPDDDEAEDSEDGPAEEVLTSSFAHDRLWLIQCKREKAIGPKKLVDYLDAIPPESKRNLHGIVFAAASDFSITARDAFRAKMRSFGLAEGYLWGRGEIEDMLFQPKNDHLLFAYFGVSLQTRQRKLKSEIRSRLTIKRKAQRHLSPHTEILVRDASDERYPRLDRDKTKSRFDRGRWRLWKYEGAFHDGLRFLHRRHFAFVDDDGKHWDFAETYNHATPHSMHNPWAERDDAADEAREKLRDIWDAFPEENKAWFQVTLTIPYEVVLEIDEKGDEIFEGPHIFTGPQSLAHGPFAPYSYRLLETIFPNKRKGDSDDSMRVSKFPRSPPAKPNKLR